MRTILLIAGSAVSVTAGAAISIQSVRGPARTGTATPPAIVAAAVVPESPASVIAIRQVHSVPIVDSSAAPKIASRAATDELDTGAGSVRSTAPVAAPAIATATQQAVGPAAEDELPSTLQTPQPLLRTRPKTALVEPALGRFEHRAKTSRRKARAARFAAKGTTVQPVATPAPAAPISTPRWRTLSDLFGR
jgi:hypothetical protein